MKKLAALLLLAVLPLATWAADPPGRVARVSLVEGEAAVFVDPDAGWEAARINLSLTSENSAWTEPGARAELRFGATALRLGEPRCSTSFASTTTPSTRTCRAEPSRCASASSSRTRATS